MLAHDDNSILMQTISTNKQIVISYSHKERVLVLSNYHVTTGHFGCCRLYHRIERHFHWPFLATDFYQTVRNRAECAMNRINLRRNVGLMKLLPKMEPLHSVAIERLYELIGTPRGHRYILVVTDDSPSWLKLIRWRDNPHEKLPNSSLTPECSTTDHQQNYSLTTDHISRSGSSWTFISSSTTRIYLEHHTIRKPTGNRSHSTERPSPLYDPTSRITRVIWISTIFFSRTLTNLTHRNQLPLLPPN